MMTWIADRARDCRWTGSVCTGAFALHASGVANGRRLATHWGAVADLRALGANVVEGERCVADGNIVSSAGVSAGIDMALWLVEQIYSPEAARRVARNLEYEERVASPGRLEPRQ
jgi:transcriptional regulator GlxA family with amidase domain